MRRPSVERVQEIHVQARLVVGELDLVATSVAAFLGGWLIGYLANLN
jgi:hypothetical protein